MRALGVAIVGRCESLVRVVISRRSGDSFTDLTGTLITKVFKKVIVSIQEFTVTLLLGIKNIFVSLNSD